MINIINKEDCNGCCACVDGCPTNAISLKTDIEGFWYPEVNNDECTKCGLCIYVCPELHFEELKKNDYETPFTYAAIHNNLEVRFDSTSGGLYSAFAEKMYKDGGFVGGAIYNDDFSARNFISNDKNDIKKLRSSKYLQSNATGLYFEIKKLLKKDEKVLVCGTPCQMAALRRFLKKDYDNLIIIDFICRGVNSPKVFRKYLDSLEFEMSSKITYVKAKSKELGWRNLTWKFTFENGKNLFQTKNENLFTRGYLATNVYCRPSCYDCKFKGFPRIADITIADFWGIEKIDKSLDNDLGTSMVLINSKKGKAYFEEIKSKIQCKQVAFDTIFEGNPVLTKSLNPPTINRNDFFTKLEKSSFTEVASEYFPFQNKKTFKDTLKIIYRIVRDLKNTSNLRPKPLFQFIKYNFFTKEVKSNWRINALLYTTPHSIIEIHKNSTVILNGALKFGVKKFKKSKLESRLLIEENALLELKNNYYFAYGANIEVFKGAVLSIFGNGGTNINTTIICGEKITLGNGVQIGRDVTIRDNNGGHYISRQGYKNSRPIIIGDRAWLGEKCIIMPGVKIKEGAIIGANSFVISNVPQNSIVSGNPAKIIDEDVLWKY